ncbi:Ubiquitin-conjugating enzyme E2 G2 [Nosema bombycis CQ1]|jgi:ubiquitin-conjugating enzyme E2 G2|uniref:Ubiquitin-conjugating enzyme E2 G2 n=1 Tax=Nosema bombycis (strain CQ1 / CVCC 102059) TaxID=578461 RepID=R0MGQ5_NOSB1|nr:Ubiquitin-conjugating enzyme E2 G2 [Nosema bombycis CQ1]|eukprot:EOB11933.1 Ubiquitin-conjugating enzyme E2 G2 [Nosema bombycis CQ1]
MARFGLSQTALKRLKKEKEMLDDERQTETYFIAEPRDIDGNVNFKVWDVYFYLRDENSLYKDKVIMAEMEFPEQYPLRPPKVVFLNKMFHPNVYHPTGKVCISILDEDTAGPLGCGAPEDRWAPVQNIRTILLSVVILLENPNIESPANVDASKLLRDNLEEYKKIVVELANNENDKNMKNEKIKMIVEELRRQKNINK